MNLGKYFCGVLVFAVLWPLVLIPLMRRTLKVENNGLTLLLLVTIVAIPVALAYPWAFGTLYSITRAVSWFVFLAAIVLWTTYIMSRTADSVAY